MNTLMESPIGLAERSVRRRARNYLAATAFIGPLGLVLLVSSVLALVLTASKPQEAEGFYLLSSLASAGTLLIALALRMRLSLVLKSNRSRSQVFWPIFAFAVGVILAMPVYLTYVYLPFRQFISAMFDR